MSTLESLKAQAKRLRNHLTRHNMPLTHSQSLEAVAALHGYRDWNTAHSALSRAPVIETALLLEVTQSSTADLLERDLQALLRMAPQAIRFQLEQGLSVELVRVAQALAAQVERVGINVSFSPVLCDGNRVY
ncbi:glyoxalase superfamily protein [Pseudomonas sp. EMN2]|uniref:glyoxalase superfamily protein n=1 Tax=Pseudomonas sp. EMN2 TaxID=2615212 RepID=UPI00129B48D0|nr:glyoxalase superfamily protein [Pseudomonas sp. EMN2]